MTALACLVHLRHIVCPPVVLLTFFVFASDVRAEGRSDELKQRILAQAQSVSPDDYAFTRTVVSERTSKGKTETHVNVETFDPAKPADAYWTLVSVDGAPPSAEALAGYKKDTPKRRVPGYHRLAKYFGTAASVSADLKGRTVFHFASLPKESAIVFDSDVSRNTVADVTVGETNGTSFAELVRLTVKPMRLKMLMKLERYESTARYRLGPEGKPLLIEHVADVSGSGLGQEGHFHTIAAYSDHHAVKK